MCLIIKNGILLHVSPINVNCAIILYWYNEPQFDIPMTVQSHKWCKHLTASTHITYTQRKISYKNSKQPFG